MTDATQGRVAAVDASLTDDVSFLIARANALSLAAGNAALVPHGLRVRSYSVLAMAGSGSRPNQREIADFLRLDPSQVVALIDDLQAKALVERMPDPRDRRTNVVVATDDGVATLGRARIAVAVAERELHADLSESDRRTLTTLLRRLAFPG